MEYLTWGSYILSVLVAAAFVLWRMFNRNARAERRLRSYIHRHLSDSEIGRTYERYIGHLYETQGDSVHYHGALNGYADLGRDLIVETDEEVIIIQAKCWSRTKLIRENLVYQLYGTTAHYKFEIGNRAKKVKAILFSTTQFSEVAQDAAKILGVELRVQPLDRYYPMVKCAIGYAGEKTYHLPFDDNYDSIKIDRSRGEIFAKTIKQAVNDGFKRAS